MGIVIKSLKKFGRQIKKNIHGEELEHYNHAEKFILAPFKLVVEPIIFIPLGLFRSMVGTGELALGCFAAVVWDNPTMIYFGIMDIAAGIEYSLIEGVKNPIKSLLKAPHNGKIAYQHSRNKNQQIPNFVDNNISSDSTLSPNTIRSESNYSKLFNSNKKIPIPTDEISSSNNNFGIR